MKNDKFYVRAATLNENVRVYIFRALTFAG